MDLLPLSTQHFLAGLESPLAMKTCTLSCTVADAFLKSECGC